MKIRHNMTFASFLAGSLATAVLSMNTASADSAAWTGAVDGMWSNVNNWSGPPAAVPGPGDTATFNSTSAGGVIDLGAGVEANQIRFEASAPTLTIGAGAINSQPLTLTGGDPFSGGGGSAGQTLTINADHQRRSHARGKQPAIYFHLSANGDHQRRHHHQPRGRDGNVENE